MHTSPSLDADYPPSEPTRFFDLNHANFSEARRINVHSGHSASATAFGMDILFDARLTTRQGAILAKMVRWYMPAEVLKMATADNGDLMGLSGFINPYPGKLGVVEQGAIADRIAAYIASLKR
jgi:imidazolonepropionase-like amidohydrolase